jgi:hypothetical protein
MILLSLLLYLANPSEKQEADLYLFKTESKNITHLEEVSCKKCKFKKHFAILDSIVSASPKDTIYNCWPGSIYFMVQNTGIEVSTEGTLLGRISFSKYDWIRWHDWYDRRYNKKKKNKL